MKELIPAILTKINAATTALNNIDRTESLSELSIESADMTTNQVSFDITGTGVFFGAWISQSIASNSSQSDQNAYFDLYLDDSSTYERIYCSSCASNTYEEGTGNGNGLWTKLSFSERLKIVFNGYYSVSASAAGAWCYGLAYKLDS